MRTNLKAARKAAGLTQQQMADMEAAKKLVITNSFKGIYDMGYLKAKKEEAKSA